MISNIEIYNPEIHIREKRGGGAVGTGGKMYLELYYDEHF
jgi:hypothetical protein